MAVVGGLLVITGGSLVFATATFQVCVWQARALSQTWRLNSTVFPPEVASGVQATRPPAAVTVAPLGALASFQERVSPGSGSEAFAWYA